VDEGVHPVVRLLVVGALLNPEVLLDVVKHAPQVLRLEEPVAADEDDGAEILGLG